MIFAFIFGIIAGVLAGLIPGLHINLIAGIIVAISSALLKHVTVLDLAIFIIAMGITQSFIEAIPSIFLGAPDSTMGLVLLPGHKLLLEGKGYDAVRFTTIGALFCLVLTVVLFPVILYVFPIVFKVLRPKLGWVLVILIIILIAKERRDFWKSGIVFLSTGVLGLIVLRFLEIKQPLLPLLSGLFGASSLLLALHKKTEIPVQYNEPVDKLKKRDAFKGIVCGLFGGTLVTLFPGLGPGNAGALATIGIRATSRSYLVLIGGLHAADFAGSLATLVAINKARNGAIVAIKELMLISQSDLILLAGVVLSAGAIAALLALGFAKLAGELIGKINYSLVCKIVLVFLAVLVLIISGWKGFIILIFSALIGLLAPLLKVSRAHSMGCLLLPVLSYYF